MKKVVCLKQNVFFTPTRVASDCICNPLFYPSVEWAHCLFIQTYRQTGAMIGAKEPKHILVLQLTNNLLPNLFFWENRSSCLFFLFRTCFNWNSSACRTLHIYTGGFSSSKFMSASKCSVLCNCFSDVLPLSCLCKQSHQSYQHIKPEINFRATRQLLWEKKSQCTHFMAHPVGNIADQISRCLLQRYLSSVFQHNYPYANYQRLSLLIFFTGKQTDWHAYTQTQANGWLTG